MSSALADPDGGQDLATLAAWIVHLQDTPGATPHYGDGLYLWYDEEMIPALEPLRKAKSDRVNAATYMKINEKRQAMGLDDADGGDVILVPSTNVPLELAGEVSLPEPGSPADITTPPDPNAND